MSGAEGVSERHRGKESTIPTRQLHRIHHLYVPTFSDAIAGKKAFRVELLRHYTTSRANPFTITSVPTPPRLITTQYLRLLLFFEFPMSFFSSSRLTLITSVSSRIHVNLSATIRIVPTICQPAKWPSQTLKHRQQQPIVFIIFHYGFVIWNYIQHSHIGYSKYSDLGKEGYVWITS